MTGVHLTLVTQPSAAMYAPSGEVQSLSITVTRCIHSATFQVSRRFTSEIGGLQHGVKGHAEFEAQHWIGGPGTELLSSEQSPLACKVVITGCEAVNMP